ncbi:MAG: thioesterase family protein [Rikenellaceae bacterium]
MTHTKIQIRWSDIDQLSHVYNGQYQHFYDTGKSEYFAQYIGIQSNWAHSTEGFVTVRTLNNYYIPVEIHEDIVIETKAHKVGTKSFELFQRMINSVSGEVKSDSHSVMVCYNPMEKTTYDIPEEMRKLLEEDI